MDVEGSPWLDAEGAARHLGMSSAFVRKCVLQNRLRHYKVGRRLRFHPDDLDEFVRSGQVDAERGPIGSMGVTERPASG